MGSRKVTEYAYRKRPGSPCPACLARGKLSFISVFPWTLWKTDDETGEKKRGGSFYKCMNYLEGDRGCMYSMGLEKDGKMPHEWDGVPELVEPDAGKRTVTADAKGRRCVGRK